MLKNFKAGQGIGCKLAMACDLRDQRMSQPEIAKKAGISVPYLSQIETNKRKGSLDVLSAIAKALNVSLETIVSLRPKPG